VLEHELYVSDFVFMFVAYFCFPLFSLFVPCCDFYIRYRDYCDIKKVKEVDLYSAFIEVPYTQGAQVRITQCYLQITPYLPLPRKHSPNGASQTEVADIY